MEHKFQYIQNCFPRKLKKTEKLKSKEMSVTSELSENSNSFIQSLAIKILSTSQRIPSPSLSVFHKNFCEPPS